MELKGFSFARITRYLIIAGVLALVADMPNSLGSVYFASKVFLYICLFVSLFFPLRYSLIFLLMISIVCQDIVQMQTESMERGVRLLASMWQGRWGFLRPGWFMMAYCLALLVRNRVWLADLAVRRAVVWFSTVPVVTGLLYGGFSTSVASIEVPNDVKLPLFLLVSILLYRSYLGNRPDALPEFAAAFVGCVFARHFIDLAYWIVGKGSVLSEIARVSVDSTKGTVVFMLLFAITLAVRQRRILVGGALGIASGVLLIVYSTRGLWVSAVIGIFLLLLSVRARRWLVAMPIAVLLAYGCFLVLSAVNPENIDLARKRASKQIEIETGNVLQDIDPNRYAEISNAADATLERAAVLWGSGYGSYYTESAISFPATMQNAFPEYSFVSGRFYFLHNFLLAMVFKYGLIGFSIIASLWLVPGWHCFRAFRNPPPGMLLSLMVAIVAFLPTSMLEMYWTGKGMIVGGFLVAFCMTAYEQRDNIRGVHVHAVPHPSREEAGVQGEMTACKSLGHAVAREMT